MFYIGLFSFALFQLFIVLPVKSFYDLFLYSFYNVFATHLSCHFAVFLFIIAFSWNAGFFQDPCVFIVSLILPVQSVFMFYCSQFLPEVFLPFVRSSNEQFLFFHLILSLLSLYTVTNYLFTLITLSSIYGPIELAFCGLWPQG